MVLSWLLEFKKRTQIPLGIKLQSVVEVRVGSLEKALA